MTPNQAAIGLWTICDETIKYVNPYKTIEL